MTDPVMQEATFPAGRVIYELPLNEWRDAEGSKMGAVDFAKGLVDILRIRSRYLP